MTERLTVVSPVFDEEGGIETFYDTLASAIDAITPAVELELVLVDDGSADRSLELMRKIARRDDRVRVIALSRNFGHQMAITAGIDHATGDAVVTIDSDLQDPPTVIREMVDRWRDGFDVVYAVRSGRAGESPFKLLTAKSFYRVINWLSDVTLPVDSGDFRLMDRKVVDALKSLREENRYIRGLVTWVGFNQCAIEYARDPRLAGQSKFTVRKMLRFAADAITSFSERPLRIAAQVGAVTTLVTLTLAGWIVAGKLIDPERSVPGFASLMVVVLFMGSVQLLTIGLLGEYVGRIYRETKRRPLYIVADVTETDRVDAAE